jgi:hypothetical protein
MKVHWEARVPLLQFFGVLCMCLSFALNGIKKERVLGSGLFITFDVESGALSQM